MSTSQERPVRERSVGDLLVLGLLCLCAAWTFASAPGNPAGPRHAASLLLAGAAYLLGRLLSREQVGRRAVALALGVGALAAVALSPGGLSGTAVALPLRYGNANGSLVVIGVAGLLLSALSLPQRPARLVGVALAAVGLPLSWATGSRAATAVTAALLLLALLLAVRPQAGRAVPVLAAVGVLLGLVTTVALALVGPQDGGLQQALSDRRVALWSEALHLVETAPLRGVGAGGFGVTAPTAVADPDARWAHSLWLQQAAETGLPGLVLLLAACAVALVRVEAEGWDDGGVPALGSAVLAGLLLQGTIDYVFHFPVIVAATGLLAGLSLAPRRID